MKKLDKIKIVLNENKIHLKFKNGVDPLVIHFNTPSRRFYFALIALVAIETKKLQKPGYVYIRKYENTLMSLDRTLSGKYASRRTEDMWIKIRKAWRYKLPDLEAAPSFKILNRKLTPPFEKGGKYRYACSEDESDIWTNLFQYDADNKWRFKFDLDSVQLGIDDIHLTFDNLMDSDAWKAFLKDLEKITSQEQAFTERISKTLKNNKNDRDKLGFSDWVENIQESIPGYRVLSVPGAGAYRGISAKRLLSAKLRKTTIAIALALVIAMAFVVVWQLNFRSAYTTVASVDKMAYPLPDKPSIAVLAFTNMSGDPEQDYIGDGLSENIINALSCLKHVFVIARNSSFTYKGKPVNVKKIAEDLGVQFVLEGSIQRSGDRLRVTAQLIDALTGHHLWSDVYNGEFKDLFELQDKIAKKIMVSLQVELTKDDDILRIAKGTNSLAAWKYYLEGNKYHGKTKEDNLKARKYFEAALSHDPEYLDAMDRLAGTYWVEVPKGWSASRRDSFDHAFQILHQAMKLNDKNADIHASLGQLYLHQRRHEKAIEEGEKAITLNPNFARGYATLGITMKACGRFGEASVLINTAYRLNPKLNPFFLIHLTDCLIFLRRYDEALNVLGQMEQHVLRGKISKEMPHLFYSWIYQELGREKDARSAMARALKLDPNLSLNLIKMRNPFKNQAHLQRHLDAYRKAGMPEKPPGIAP